MIPRIAKILGSCVHIFIMFSQTIDNIRTLFTFTPISNIYSISIIHRLIICVRVVDAHGTMERQSFQYLIQINIQTASKLKLTARIGSVTSGISVGYWIGEILLRTTKQIFAIDNMTTVLYL